MSAQRVVFPDVLLTLSHKQRVAHISVMQVLQQHQLPVHSREYMLKKNNQFIHDVCATGKFVKDAKRGSLSQSERNGCFEQRKATEAHRILENKIAVN